MLSFKGFLLLNEAKNVHLQHIEDNVLSAGVNGVRASINFLRSLRDMLSGDSKSKVNVTVKWDGSPAIWAGIDPETNKFFVGTKGVFSKAVPKRIYSEKDVDKFYSGELANKLKIAFRELSKLGIKNVIQGDMMFTSGDIQKTTINDEKLIIFQPNTIVYGVPVDSDLAKNIQKAKIGVVWHTSYSGGPTVNDMSASFDINVNKLKKTPNVWYQDASYKDVSGMATFTKAERTKLDSVLSNIGSKFAKLGSNILKELESNSQMRAFVVQHLNQKVRAGAFIGNTKSHVKDLQDWIKQKVENKPPKNLERKLSQIDDWFKIHKKNLVNMFKLMNEINTAKLIIIKKLGEVQGMSTFVKRGDGFDVVSPEGFVAVDKTSGNVVKLVDRLEFTKNNFNVQKNWDK